MTLWVSSDRFRVSAQRGIGVPRIPLSRRLRVAPPCLRGLGRPSRPESRFGRPYEAQNDFGSWRCADDGLARGVVNFRQHSVPRHGYPRIVD